MSDEVKVLFEIRSMLIMKDTLKEMGIDFNELSDKAVEIPRQYNNIVINSETGEINFDSENKGEVDKICQQYQSAWYKDQLIREGNRFTEEVSANGEIILHVTR